MNNLIISYSASEDAHDAFDWYEEQNDGLGDAFTDELEKVFQLITMYPERYRILEKGIQAAKLKRFPYLVYFTQKELEIRVIAILHERRLPDSWKDRA